MSFLTPLAAYGIRQVLGDGIERVAAAIHDLFRDHSQTLPAALQRAHKQSWQALEVALAGNSLADRFKGLFSSGDTKAIRELVQQFVRTVGDPLAGTPDQFRTACLAELKRLRESGSLNQLELPEGDIARVAAGLRRYSDPTGLADGAVIAVEQVADALGPDYPHLSRLLRTPPTGGPPMLAAVFCFYFRREVENDQALAHGLTFDRLRQLTASQEAAFAGLAQAVDAIGDKLGQMHGAVLDLQAELRRLGDLHLGHAEEVRQLHGAVRHLLDRAGMAGQEVKPQYSLSLHNEQERQMVKRLLEQFRQLPADEQKRLPALLNGLGKLQVGIGEFAAARQTFGRVAAAVTDGSAKAGAVYNSYRAAIEEKRWDDALRLIQQATDLDSSRFAPFPLLRYQPKRILGAGGFGTAFLCHDENFHTEVVVKALHADILDRSAAEVFAEARVLRQLSHPAIIRVQDCAYTDPVGRTRPYLVMEYFPGDTLEQYLSEHGQLNVDEVVQIAAQAADGMRVVHAAGLLHRDLKPANLLIRKEGTGWQVRIIDFGLALRQTEVEPSPATPTACTPRYAAPEQLGWLSQTAPGPYSDVYAFGKTCCQALFGTTAPLSRHWATIPIALGELLQDCLEEDVGRRLPGFEPVVQTLTELARGADSVDADPEEEGPDLYDAYP